MKSSRSALAASNSIISWTGRLILPVLAWACAGLAVAQPVMFGPLRFEAPDGWVRLDEQRSAVFSPPDDPELTLSVFTGLGDEGAEDALDDFIRNAERDQKSMARGDSEEISDDPFDVYLRQTSVLTDDGADIVRLYAGADPGDIDTIIVLSGPASSVQRVRPQLMALLSSLRVDAEGPAAPAAELPGDGGLDGSYISISGRRSLSAESGRWSMVRRADVITFDPLGEVRRGPAERAGVALFDSCDGGIAWRCGRYRIEGDHISLRWNDGTIERRSLRNLESSLLINAVPYAAMSAQDASQVIGEYAFADLFNAGDWPSADGNQDTPIPSVRFLEGGKFSLSGFTKFRNPQFGKAYSANGRFRIAGSEITLVYRSGAVEVLSLSAFDDNGQRGLMIGGRAFNVSAQ